MASDLCARCYQPVGTYHLSLNDGGSFFCPHCKQRLHHESNGKTHASDTAPSSCLVCAAALEQQMHRCPVCGTSAPRKDFMFAYDGGSQTCPKCSVKFHMAKDQTVHFGTPGRCCRGSTIRGDKSVTPTAGLFHEGWESPFH